MSTKIDIVDIEGDWVSLQVRYGADRTARIEITTEPAYERQPIAEASRQQLTELSDALDEWLTNGGEIGDLSNPKQPR